MTLESLATALHFNDQHQRKEQTTEREIQIREDERGYPVIVYDHCDKVIKDGLYVWRESRYISITAFINPRTDRAFLWCRARLVDE